MRIEVTGHGLEVTDAIREHANAKCSKLLKYYDGIQEIECVLETESERHDAFAAEIMVSLVKHDSIVAKAITEDIYASIDSAVDKAVRQISDFKERLREHR